jgi:hypothetical protein
MSYVLSCNCTGRYIKHEKTGSFCSKCGTQAWIDTGMKAAQMQQLDVDYECPITGIPIRSKKAHEENLLKHGKHVLEKGELADAKRTRKELDDALDKKIGDSAAQFVHDLPEDKKKQLEVELLTSELQYGRS